jgi:imidazolonepropionase-like amidohydrolase
VHCLSRKHGVTTVRELNGAAWHIALRDSIARGERPGPRLFVTSPLLSGIPFPAVRHVIVPTPDSARALVDRYAAERYDAIKIYDGLNAASYAALVARAREKRLPLTGHIPHDVGLEGVLAAGQSIEHVEKIVYATTGTSNPDTGQAPLIAKRIVALGGQVVFTLAAQKALNLGRVMPSERARSLYALQAAIVRELYRAGAPVLLGTDVPNARLLPGLSIHDEIDTLIEAGIPAAAVLRGATAGAAHYLGAPDWGRVQPGASADLLLLEQNPIDSPRTLRQPARIMVRGVWF